jgi:phage terminase large subunit-like protein
VRQITREFSVRAIAYDPWGWDYFVPSLSRAGFSGPEIKEKFIPFPQNIQNFSPAIKHLETLVLERKIRHGNHAVLNSCIASSIIVMDANGNRRIDKKRSTGRIDGTIALIMALACAPRTWTQPFDASALIG